MVDRLVTLEEAATFLCVTKQTLRQLSDTVLSTVRTKGGHRRYWLSSLYAYVGKSDTFSQETSVVSVITYARVSSFDQKSHGDLDRQKIRLHEYCIKQGWKIEASFEECGSGMNDSRPKLRKIIESAKEGRFKKLVVEHKDRLTRFNFNLFSLFFSQCGVEVICVEEVLPKSFENELVEDMVGLLTSFSAKIYGKRSHQNKEKSNVSQS
jgi:putative resolvase